MEAEVAFYFINDLLMQKNQRSLNEYEKDVFLGIWNNETYQEISEFTHRDFQTVKETGSKLFKKIHQVLGIQVKKNSFKPAIESLWQKHSQKNSSPPELDDKISNSSSLETPSHSSQLNFGNNWAFKNSNSNPFIPPTGMVDNPELFFNHPQLLNQIFEIINSGVNVALIGEEGTGKSTLLSATCRLSKANLLSPRQPVYLDLYGIDDEDDFYRDLCKEIGIPQSSGSTLRRALKPHKLLLVMDNVDKMQRFSLETREQLRSLSEGSQASLKVVVAASEPLDKLFNDQKASPFSGIFIQVDINYWDENTIGTFIKSRLDKTAVCFSDEEIANIVIESVGHPRRLMQLCYETFSRYMEPIHEPR
ncbi:MAG TPA: AAA family ATPase [Halomicronema sp.]